MSQELHVRAMLTGDPGTGKDKTAAGLQEMFRLKGVDVKFLSMGDEVFRPMAVHYGIPIEELHERLKQDPTLDVEADQRLLRLFDEPGNLITTSRMGPALLRQGKIHTVKDAAKVITICFDCEETVRIKRIIHREVCKPGGKRLSDEDVVGIFPHFRRKTLLREYNDEMRFHKLYGIKNIFDKKYFHETMDTTNMSLDEQIRETYEVIMRRI